MPPSHALIELTDQISKLETTLAEDFETHPDADIYRSLPGLGVILSARVLGEFGDAPNRYTTAKSRKNYAGTSPLTVASGRQKLVRARHVRNDRLYDAADRWAFAALQCSPGARMFYDQHRAAGDTHHQALRALPTASSASCTVASTTRPSTTKKPPGHTDNPLPLDSYDPGMS